MYKDHPDVDHFFTKGVEQKLLKGKVLIGYRQAWGNYRRTLIDYDSDYFVFCDYDYD